MSTTIDDLTKGKDAVIECIWEAVYAKVNLILLWRTCDEILRESYPESVTTVVNYWLAPHDLLAALDEYRASTGKAAQSDTFAVLKRSCDRQHVESETRRVQEHHPEFVNEARGYFWSVRKDTFLRLYKLRDDTRGTIGSVLPEIIATRLRSKKPEAVRAGADSYPSFHNAVWSKFCSFVQIADTIAMETVCRGNSWELYNEITTFIDYLSACDVTSGVIEWVGGVETEYHLAAAGIEPKSTKAAAGRIPEIKTSGQVSTDSRSGNETRAAPPKKRPTPKATEQRGKCSELVDLIRSQQLTDSGRSLEEMRREVGVPKDTFRKSVHFINARNEWASLKAARKRVPSEKTGEPRSPVVRLDCRSCRETYDQYTCPLCSRTPDQCEGCHAEVFHPDALKPE